MTKRRAVTVEVKLRPDASPPRITGVRFVKALRGERDPELKLYYLAYLPAANVRSLLAKIAKHPAVESAKRIAARTVR